MGSETSLFLKIRGNDDWSKTLTLHLDAQEKRWRETLMKNLSYELREQSQRRTMLYLVKGLPEGRSTSTRKPFNTLRHLSNVAATPPHLDGQQQTETNNTIVLILPEKASEGHRTSTGEQ
jgi:hypothetical protein